MTVFATLRLFVSASVILAFVPTLGCSSQTSPLGEEQSALISSAAEIEQEVLRIPLDFTVFNACAGEEVHFTGFALMITHEGVNRGVDPDELLQHSVEKVIFKMTGLGLDSGATYQFEGTDFNMFQSESPTEPDPLALHFTSTSELTREGDGVIASLTFNFVLVFNANGDIAGFHFQDVADECLFG